MKAKLELQERRLGGPKNLPMMTLNVRDRYGKSATIVFIVDTGADRCAIPVSLALRECLDFRRDETTRRAASGLVGEATVWRGTLTVTMFGEEFEWPCDFVVGGTQNYGVIGREGFLDAFGVCVEPPWLRLSRRLPWYRRLLTPFARTFDPQRPL